MLQSLEPLCELMSIPDTCPKEEGCKDFLRLDPSITLHREENEANLLVLPLILVLSNIKSIHNPFAVIKWADANKGEI